jgi:hypothetical protein
MGDAISAQFNLKKFARFNAHRYSILSPVKNIIDQKR